MSDLNKKLDAELSLLLDSITGLTGAIESVSSGTTGETLSQLVTEAQGSANDSATAAAQAATIQLEIQNSILAAETADLNASTAAANAALSASNSYNSSVAANTSQTAAATSASQAAASATTAAQSATQATTMANEAIALYTSWASVWLGNHTTDPTLDNQGNTLISGAMYMNTASTPPQLRIYLNSAWGDFDADAETATQAAQLSAAQAASSATNAANSATAASTTAASVATQVTAAQTAATNAAASVTQAAASVAGIGDQVTAATTQATNASNSASAAATSATQAAASATTAAGSASDAANSATSAGTQATAAAGSASAASSSAGAANTSATNAAASAATATTQATAASGSAATATTQATNAAASATTAGTAATTATTQAGNASTSATNAGNSATAAAGSATTAGTAATNAGNSASAAAGSATAAAGSATAAAASATTASTAAANATALYHSWGQLWLGEFTSDPTLDNQGGALVSGAQYLNTSTTPPQVMIYLNGTWGPLDADAQAATTAAQTSATNASASASAAATQATNASNSATAAAGSATSAAGSATTATTEAGIATTQATNASGSATAAAGSASAAAGSATAASGSATTASTQASNASASATLAQAWASQPSGVVNGTSSYSAAYYAGQASTSAGAASTSASNASGSATAAAGSATAASNSASAAATNQTNAAASATSASGSAGSASTSATNASNSASAAATSATNAGTSATNASNSASAASTSATNAAASATAAAASATTAQNVQIGLNTITTLNKTGGTYSLTAAEYNNGIIIVTGTLTSNLILVVPATSHPFILDNQTTGPWSVTVKMTGGSAQVPVGQTNANQLFCDGSTGVYSVSSVSGLQFTGAKPISSSTNALTNQYQGAYTPMTNGTGSTYATTLPQGSTMGVGGAVFLDAISGTWSVGPYSGDTADFGSAFAMGPADKAMFTWNGSSWRTTLYSNQSSPVFSQQLTVPVGFITRGVFGGVADDTTTAVQATTGRFTTSLTVPTMAAGDNSFNAASTAYVYTAINNLIGGAPGNLDTLKELADAINDDTSFASTITNLVAAKAALTGATFTGAVSATTLTASTGIVNAYGYSGSSSKGMVYLDSAGSHYLYYDGTQYNLPGANLYVNGSQVLTNANAGLSAYAKLASSPNFTGTISATQSGGGLSASLAAAANNTFLIGSYSTGAGAVWKSSNTTADSSVWDIGSTTTTFYARAINDAGTATTAWLNVLRGTGYTITSVSIAPNGGIRTLIGGAVDDTYTPAQVMSGLSVQRYGTPGQSIMIATNPGGFVPNSSNTNNEITSYSAISNAKYLMLNSTTDTLDTPLTAGSLGISFLIASQTVGGFTGTGNLILNNSMVDDGVNKLQVYSGNIAIKTNGHGITFPDGTTQTTAYLATAPTVLSYTPGAGVKTFACQTYGLNLVQVFENGSFLTPAEYTATTGNSITLNNAADGKTQYTVVAGAIFNQSNVIQPQVSVQTIAQGSNSITLPISTPQGYLWIFQNSAWLIPGVDFTFTGGTSVTLTAAAAQGSDTFTLVMLQPVSFSGSATIAALQAASYTFAMDTGAANAYAVAYIPAVNTPTNGMQLTFFVNVGNTGASTLTCNGGTAYPIYGNGHAALSGGELVAGGFVEVVFNSTLGAWVLLENTGGAQQLAGNLNLVGTGRRITGDYSNATVASRVMFQTSTASSATSVGAVGSAGGTGSNFVAFSGSDPNNAAFMMMSATASATALTASFTGSGAYAPMTFVVGGAERMRITTVGQVLVTNTVSGGGGSYVGGAFQISTTANGVRQLIQGHANNQGYGTVFMNGSEQSTNASACIFANSAGSLVGSITATTSATSFNTTSDYRLKENIQPAKGALARVLATRVIHYTFKNDSNQHQQDGFLAHELQEHHPRAVTGEKDATWTDVTYRKGHDPKNIQPDDVVDIHHHIVPQVVDHSKLVPTLWAAVQELKAELDAARAEIAELKKKVR